MTRDEIYEKLNAVFQDIFDNPEIRVCDETTAKDVPGWDSLSHISLLSAIEDEFEIEFSMGETVNLKNVGQMVDIIEREA